MKPLRLLSNVVVESQAARENAVSPKLSFEEACSDLKMVGLVGCVACFQYMHASVCLRCLMVFFDLCALAVCISVALCVH